MSYNIACLYSAVVIWLLRDLGAQRAYSPSAWYRRPRSASMLMVVVVSLGAMSFGFAGHVSSLVAFRAGGFSLPAAEARAAPFFKEMDIDERVAIFEFFSPTLILLDRPPWKLVGINSPDQETVERAERGMVIKLKKFFLLRSSSSSPPPARLGVFDLDTDDWRRLQDSIGPQLPGTPGGYLFAVYRRRGIGE